MKTVQKLLLIALTTTLVLPSCKKGDDDPFLSLRSRKSRVAGEWTVDSKVESITTTVISPSATNTSTSTTTTSGSTYSEVYTDNSGTNTVTGSVGSNTITFEKDGSWKSSSEITVVNVFGSGSFATTETTVRTTERSGIWNFLGKIGDAKNKESMSVSTTEEKITTRVTTVNSFTGTDINTTTQTNTFAQNESVEIWKLTQLKNKEMKGEITIDNSSFSTSTGSSSSTTTKHSGTTQITLKQ